MERDGRPVMVRTTAVIRAPTDIVPTAGIPEELSAPVAQKLQEESQHQLPLMR